jgi:hypothetical protein
LNAASAEGVATAQQNVHYFLSLNFFAAELLLEAMFSEVRID